MPRSHNRSQSHRRRAGYAEHHASNCRWAVPTVFLPAPFWWEAEDRPWACVREGTPRTLETTEVCADCPYWEPRTREQPALPATIIEVLREVLDDTYRARATCRKVIEGFGSIRPFVTILHAEERHARALRALFKRFGVEAPRDTWPTRLSAPDTLVEACAAASRSELDREAMYQRVIPLVQDPAVRRILRRIQESSYMHHLPAYRRCFARALKPTGRPRGVRAGRG